ncbi:hypothetical protein OE810_05260 [Rhodobacteraceae bacterium XHP0102]|nr:hypothetical protein [Rhodobacteraceae bacterium XHP0102]
MNKVLDTICEHGYRDLTETQFKSEGRYPLGGTSKAALVYALKSGQLRIYGVFVSEIPKRLVCPEGTKKKKRKADRKQLERVAKKVGEDQIS